MAAPYLTTTCSRALMVLGLSTTVLVIAASFATGASAERAPGARHTSTSQVAGFHPMKPRTCFDQSDNDIFIGIISQNFESAFDAYDSRGADDFTLKRTCLVTTVVVYGTYYAGGGPLISENVTFYRDRAGVPGRVISNQPSLVGEDDGLGDVTIVLDSPVALSAGRYWVSVQGNMDFSVSGEWGWYTHNKQRGSLATWRNRAGGFDTGCDDYTPIKTCFDNGQGPDFVFLLRAS